MLWLSLVVTLAFLGFAAVRSPKAGWLLYVVTVAVLVGVTLTARFGPRFLPVVAPTLGLLGWRFLQARAASRGVQPPLDAAARGSMSRAHALLVLGLREGASRAEILDAHRTLIKKVHPDRGGSDLLAQQVNEAKRVLESGG